MKTYLTISILLLCGVAYAQTDSLTMKYDQALQEVELKKLDSLNQSFTRQSDSIRNAYTEKVQKLALLRQRYTSHLDSIKSNRAFSRNSFDSLHAAPDVAQYTQKLDSLDQQLENVQQKTTATLDSLKERISQKINSLKLPNGAEEKVTGLTSAMDKVNLPAFNSDIAARSGLNIPSMPNLSGNLPGIDLPNTNLPALNGNVPGMDVKAPDIAGQLPASSLNTTKLNDFTGKAGDLQKQVANATASPDAIGNTLEGKVAEQVKGLPEQKLPNAAGLPGGLPKTGDEAKKQLVDITKKEAVNHFAGKEAVLTGAMEKMSTYKQKYNSLNSLKDIKDEKNHNPLKGKPLRERLVPALTLQFQRWQDFMLDLNPSVGYKLNSKIVVGFGWNQRVSFNISDRAFNRYSNVHGVRSYGEYMFKKGFGFRIDLECMNTPLKNITSATDIPPQRDWVWSALIGVKQKYPIYKKLKGNAQVMYNIVDKDHRSPYIDRLNWRIGLEFTLPKKKPAKNT